MSDWNTFINQQHTSIQTRNYIGDASALGLILITGDDAELFLQNQFSNDIKLIDETRFQFSSYSTPKGRMLAIFRIVRISNGFILITPLALVSNLLQRLQMYVVQSKVVLADASEYFTRFTIQTSDNSIINNDLLPRAEGGVFQNDDLISLQLTCLNDEKRYLVLCLSADMAKSLWSELGGLLNKANFESWRLSEIKSGVPVIYPETSEEFVLQMSNLNLLDGVSFKKGCFPGQEIVARMQYLGTLKRRMFLSCLNTASCPVAGDDLSQAGATSVDGSGKVVDAVTDEDGVTYCLYIAQIKKALAGQLRLLNQPDLIITPVDLPYLGNSA